MSSDQLKNNRFYSVTISPPYFLSLLQKHFAFNCVEHIEVSRLRLLVHEKLEFLCSRYEYSIKWASFWQHSIFSSFTLLGYNWCGIIRGLMVCWFLSIRSPVIIIELVLNGVPTFFIGVQNLSFIVGVWWWRMPVIYYFGVNAT